MPLARFQRTVVDEAGNILDGATVTVTDETTGQLASLFSDRNGLNPIGNPIFSDLNGFAAFFVAGGAYRITAVKGSDSVEWRYVGIGTAQEFDAIDIVALVQQVNAGFALGFEAETTAPPGAGRIRFDNEDLSAATKALVSVQNLGGSDVQALLLGLFDAGRTRKDRFTLEDVANNTIASFQIDGATAVGSPATHVALTISGHTGETAFTDDTVLNFQPSLAGADGEDGTDGEDGEVLTTGTVLDGQFTQFAGSSGANIKGGDLGDSPPTPLTLADAAAARAATPGGMLHTGLIESASAPVAMSDTSTIVFDWAAGINRTVTLGGNRAMGTPTNGQPGTWRRVQVTQDGTGNRTLNFATSGAYRTPGGAAPQLSTGAGDIDVFFIYCRSASVFEVYSGGLDWVAVA